jgi:HSP20 family protein
MEHSTKKKKVHDYYPGEYKTLPELEMLPLALQKYREGIVLQPLINIQEDATAIILEAAVPGARREHFLIEVDHHTLSIALMTKCADEEETKNNFQLHEFNYACFKRQITLPEDVHPELAVASYNNGLLQIYLPKGKDAVSKLKQRIVVY